MRTFWMALLASGVIAAGQAVALAAEPADADGDGTRKVDAVDRKAAAKAEFEAPTGFVKKQRGKVVLYCKKDTEVGTRFKRETCYDEAQMKDYLLAREHNNRDFDQRRAICATPAVCRIE